MKITRYLWINNLPKRCDEEVIQKTFQSHGKIQTIRIHEINNSRGAIVAFIDCKSSTKAYESVKTILNMPLKLDYCEANGEPGINSLGTGNDSSKSVKGDNQSGSNKNSDSRSRSSSSSSNTSSFGSSLDDCSKYPTIQISKRLDNNSIEGNGDRSNSKSPRPKPCDDSAGANLDKNDENCLNKDYRGILVENLSQRSSDTSLREGLFHEYKKHGKITSVAVMGQGTGRHAIISFKRSEDMEKAFETSNGKIFFGNPIRVKKHNGYNYIDPDLCPPEHAMDEYHPKATKTLFVGKLATGAVVELDLRKVFKKYGEIIDIDIKTQSNQPDTSFAFVQYYDISSVVRALRNQDSIKVDGKPVKLGFGKSQPANCLWVGNLQRNANDSFLRRHFKRFGSIMLVIPDPEYNCALIQFEGAEDALRAFTDTRERSNNSNTSRRMQVDYASNEYQLAFMNRLRKSCQFDTQDFLKNISDPYQTEKIQNLLISYTKCLGLLDDTRTRSYDRYDPKSDYDDYDDYYTSRPSRQRKSVHQRLYNDSYGVDDDYSDEYHYSKPKSRHYDDYSSSRSPVRYSRPSQKYPSEQYGSHDSRRSNYQHYSNNNNGEYYDGKTEPSSSTYYPYRRTPDTAYIHSNHNRSFSPSPTSSVDYCDDYPRYNLSPRRYSRSNKDYHTSRSRQLDLHDGHDHHFERTSEIRNWTKPTSRRDLDDFTSSFRSKSGSRSKVSDSLSPHPRTSASRLRAIKTDQSKKTRPRRANATEDLVQRPSVGKVINSGNGGSRSAAAPSRTKAGVPCQTSAASSSTAEAARVPSEQGTLTSVVQPVDALSKLERERAKLLEELSLLSEDTAAATSEKANKVVVKSAPKTPDAETSKSRKKHVSPKESSVAAPVSAGKSSGAVTEKKPVIATETPTSKVKTEPRTSDVKSRSRELPAAPEKVPLFDAATLACPGSCPAPSEVGGPRHGPPEACTDVPAPKKEMLPASPVPQRETVSSATEGAAGSSQSRDPRLNLGAYHLRPVANPLAALSPVDLGLVLPGLPPTPAPVEPLCEPAPASSSYKDSTSDSDMDHFSNIDFDLDKRIRELDARMNRNEQTVRTLDYSKFRIRKKVNEGAPGCVTTANCSSSSPAGLMASPSCSLAATGLLEGGYSGLGRDCGSNTSEFIKTMLNQTKQKTYHPLSEAGADHLAAMGYSGPSSACSSLPFRPVDLGANDMERRTLFSRFGSSSSNGLSFPEGKLTADPTPLNPPISSYQARPPTSALVVTTASSKLAAPYSASPSAVSSASTPITPNGLDSGPPMKSILKKSNSIVSSSSSKQPSSKQPSGKLPPDPSPAPKTKTSQDPPPSEPTGSHGGGGRPQQKVSHPSIKRKTKSESDEVDFKPHFKKSRNENGPVLDDTLFQSYPTMPVKKKLKKSIKKSLVAATDPRSQSISKKSSSSLNSLNHSLGPEKLPSKKPDRNVVAVPPNQKLSKMFKETTKANSKLLITKKPKMKPTAASHLKSSDPRKGSSKSSKLEKAKKMSKRNKEKVYHESRESEPEENEDLEDEIDERFSDEGDEGDSGSSDNDNYESMYDKIKRRKSKANRQSEESKRRHLFDKKRRLKQAAEAGAGSSDNLDSEDSEYWSVRSSKRSLHQKRKRPRLSDLSSSHFSDSNSCKTTPCGRTQESHPQGHGPQGASGGAPLPAKALYGARTNGDHPTKEEPLADESRAATDHPRLVSTPPLPQPADPLGAQHAHPGRNRSQHRPSEGPLKKRPIAEPILLSEDLPYLEKQADEEDLAGSPTSINEEPPSQLESMYDVPASQQQQHHGVLEEEVVIDDHHHCQGALDAAYLGLQESPSGPASAGEGPLPADVDSASHILLTMKSQAPPLEAPDGPGSSEPPDQQLQSVAEHLISLAHIAVQPPPVAEPVPTAPSSEEQTAPLATSVPLATTTTASCPPSASSSSRTGRPAPTAVAKDDDCTIYVKNIIDRIRQETDTANSLSKDRLACKRAKKTSTFNMPLSKPLLINSLNHECRHILPIDLESAGRLAAATITTASPALQQLTLATVTPACVMLPAGQPSPEVAPRTQPPPTQTQAQRPPQPDERTPSHGEEIPSTPSADKRVRHNSAKSDCQLQSLDETIDNVVKSSMSSSASDAVSTKSVTDVDVSIDEAKSLSNSYESLNVVKGDLSSLEETMNEVINKMSVTSPSTSVSSAHNQAGVEPEAVKSTCPGSNSAAKSAGSHEAASKQQNQNQLQQQQKKTLTLNHVKPSVYQLTGNVGGIANLVLGIPSILTVNTLVSQQNQNQINHMVTFQNSVSGQGQLALPLNKLAVTSMGQTSSCSQGLSSLSLTAAGLQGLQGLHQGHGHGGGHNPQEMMFTKINPLTPIMIQAPLRSLTPMGGSGGPGKASQGPRAPPAFVSVCSSTPSDAPHEAGAGGGKLVSLALSSCVSQPISTPTNMGPVRAGGPLAGTHGGLNLAKIAAAPLDSYYLMMQRPPLAPLPGQQPHKPPGQTGPADSNLGISSGGHSIILSQLTHNNSVLSPITPGYLTASVNRSIAATATPQTLTTTNGVATTCPSSATTSILFRPVSIPFPKFEEKDDWLKQNKQLDWNYPIRWTGKLCLKNDEVFVQMHMLAGNEDLIRNSMSLISAGQVLSQPLRIVQRMRLEPNQLEGLQRRLARQLEFCTCLTLAGGDKADELARTSATLHGNFISYLQEKSAAGIINICLPDSQQNAYVIHIFPPCDFSDKQLRACSSRLYDRLKEHAVPYLVIVITTV